MAGFLLGILINRWIKAQPTLYFDTHFEKNRRFENTPSKPLKLRLFHGRKSKNQNSQTVRICVFCV